MFTDGLIHGFCYCNLTRETCGFELASTITLALQANRLTKCTSHLKYHFWSTFSCVPSMLDVLWIALTAVSENCLKGPGLKLFSTSCAKSRCPLFARSFERGHLVRACALWRQLKPVILKWYPTFFEESSG